MLHAELVDAIDEIHQIRDALEVAEHRAHVIRAQLAEAMARFDPTMCPLDIPIPPPPVPSHPAADPRPKRRL